MKKTLFFLALMSILISCNAQKPKRFSQPLDVQGTIINDTIFKFPNGGFIRRASGGAALYISPNGGEEYLIVSMNTQPDGLTFSGFQTIRFSKSPLYADLTGFRNDTSQGTFPDSTTAWSIKAIKDYIAEHGGGESATIPGSLNEILLSDGAGGAATNTSIKWDASEGGIFVSDLTNDTVYIRPTGLYTHDGRQALEYSIGYHPTTGHYYQSTLKSSEDLASLNRAQVRTYANAKQNRVYLEVERNPDYLIQAIFDSSGMYLLGNPDTSLFSDNHFITKKWFFDRANLSGTESATIIDTAGGHAANQLVYWIDKNTLGGSDDYSISSGNLVLQHSIYASGLRRSSSAQMGLSLSDNGFFITGGGPLIIGESGNSYYDIFHCQTKDGDNDVFTIRDDSSTVFNELVLIDSLQLRTEGTSTQEHRVLGLSKTGKVKSISLPQGVQIEVTKDELTTGGESGYMFAIPSQLDGMNLVQMEAYPGEVAGDQTAVSITCYRRRSAVESLMTSTGASFSTNAVISTSYDDVEQGDQLEFRWTFSGGTTAPTGLIVQLTFQMP
ncbi:MAG: hypothetical protein JXB49_26050 [Bacteroidales bacterium]|nr:hypothetical protein [Bacteroidales bacterium]